MVEGSCVCINYNYFDVEGNPDRVGQYNDSYLVVYDGYKLRLYKL